MKNSPFIPPVSLATHGWYVAPPAPGPNTLLGVAVGPWSAVTEGKEADRVFHKASHPNIPLVLGGGDAVFLYLTKHLPLTLQPSGWQSRNSVYCLSSTSPFTGMIHLGAMRSHAPCSLSLSILVWLS